MYLSTSYRHTMAHAWAYADNEDSGSSNNMFYADGAIFSYGTHYCIAKKFPDTDLVLFNCYPNSNTTNRHRSAVREAIPYHKIVVEVPEPNIIPYNKSDRYWANSKLGYHEGNLEYLLKHMEDLKGKISRARNNKSVYMDELEAVKAQYGEYVKGMKLDKIPRTKKEYRFLRKLVSIADEIKGDFSVDDFMKREEAVRKAQRKRARNKNIKEAKELLKQWREGVNVRMGSFYKYLDHICIRISEDNVEATSGLSVPLRHAVYMYRRWKKGKEVKGHNIGNYIIVDINDERVLIGCHFIPMKEVEDVLGGYVKSGSDKETA